MGIAQKLDIWNRDFLIRMVSVSFRSPCLYFAQSLLSKKSWIRYGWLFCLSHRGRFIGSGGPWVNLMLLHNTFMNAHYAILAAAPMNLLEDKFRYS